MANGSRKRIEDVRLLDEVLSAEGNVRRVMQCHVREHHGEMVTVRAWGHSHLRLTPNHSVLTRRGYVPAGELTANDWVCIPRHAPESARVVQTAHHVAESRERSAVACSAWPASSFAYHHHNCKEVPDFIELSSRVGRILGLFLAEGSAENGRVVWSFGIHERETLAAELVAMLRDEWGLEPSVVELPHNVVTVRVYGKLWVSLFRSLCGVRAAGKRIHPDLAAGPKEFLKAMFWGWMAGDGCKESRRRCTYHFGATVSRELAMGMFDVANTLGLAPGIIKEKPQSNRYAKTRQPVWKVRVNPDPSNRRVDYRSATEDRRMWRRVRSVVREEYVGAVYNLGVEADNSYVAEGVGVHNCWCHSGTSACLIVRAINGQPYAELSAYFVGCLIKNYRDEGGWGLEGVEFMAEHGIPSSEYWPLQGTKRSYDTPECRANAKMHRITEWMELASRSKAQLVTCLLMGIPVVSDFNWWGHSVLTMDLVSLKPFKTRILNSWGDSWSDNGAGILEGNKAIPDDMTAPRVMTASLR